MDKLLELFALTSGWELLAVLLAAAYVVFAIRQSLWCWPAAAISASIYTVLFLQSGLLMESALQVFYVLMAGYGYWQWTWRSKKTGVAANGSLAITTQPLLWHCKWILWLAVCSLAIGTLLTLYTQADLVWLDTTTTVFSLFATFLVARKLLENWLYWIVIDLTYVGLFWYKGFYPTAILFAVYTVMACLGYITWRKEVAVGQNTGCNRAQKTGRGAAL